MPAYLLQVAYTSEGWNALEKNPQNRFDAIRPAVEKLGGKIISAWLSFGDYDVVAITDMPTNVEAAAFAIAVAGGGSCKAVKTTPLMSTAEGIEAMRKAASCGYRAATAGA